MNEQVPHTIEVQYTKQDIISFNFALLNKGGSLWIFPFLALVFACVIILNIAGGHSFGDYQFFVYIMVFILSFPLILYRAASKSYENKFMKEKKTYTFTGEGFRMESPSAAVTVLWSDVQKVVKTKNAVLLFVGSNAAHIFPMRDLIGREEIVAMIDQLTSKESRKKGKSRALRNVSIYLVIFLVTVAVVQFFLAQD